MRIITPPATEPVTLAEMRAQIGITQATDTASDSTITRRIIEARMWAENYMQRALITQTQEIRLDRFPAGAIKMPYPNLLTVVSVKYVDGDGTLQTWSSANYVVDTYDHIGSVRPAYSLSWPSTRDEPNAVRVQYTCGYGPAKTDVPDLIREGIMLLVGHWMNFQPGLESGITISRVPYAVKDIFDMYAVVKV